MAAEALMPKSGWQVLDACSAPGNKTVQLAALMRGEGKIIACELHEERVRRLESTVKRSGATNINIFHGDFLEINPMDPSFSEIHAILLDPSCSGSGTSAERLDYLLPSSITDHDSDPGNSERVKKLAAFQKKALVHALSFPAVERVVYSTCSIFQTENEDVISSVLPLAFSLGFRLATPFSQWPRRGLPVFEGSEHLIRTDVAEDMEGFFIALFVRGSNADVPAQFVPCRGGGNASQLRSQEGPENPKALVRDHKKPVNRNLSPALLRKGIPYPSPKMHLLSLHMQSVRIRLVRRCTVQ